jgi:hypothetical protein
MEENTEKTASIVRGVPFVKGDDPRRNIEGRPKGSKNFSTDFDEVVKEIAEQEKITKSEARKFLLKMAYREAKNGNFNFYKDIIDRYYGKAPDNVNLDAQVNIAYVDVLKVIKEKEQSYDIDRKPNTENTE